MDFTEYQSAARRTKFYTIDVENDDIRETLSRQYLISGLVSQVGEMASRLKKKIRDGDDYVLLRVEIAERIGFALWYAAMLADELGLSLESIAEQNAKFNERRWWQANEVHSLFANYEFDIDYPLTQRLPETLMVEFSSDIQRGVAETTVWMYPEWPLRDSRIQFGDSINDNVANKDHYSHPT